MATFSKDAARKVVSAHTTSCPYGLKGALTIVTFDDGLVRWHCTTSMIVGSTPPKTGIPEELKSCLSFCPGQDMVRIEDQ
jgi:hypothetical protein